MFGHLVTRLSIVCLANNYAVNFRVSWHFLLFLYVGVKTFFDDIMIVSSLIGQKGPRVNLLL